jgi:transposase InsO family protein
MLCPMLPVSLFAAGESESFAAPRFLQQSVCVRGRLRFLISISAIKANARASRALLSSLICHRGRSCPRLADQQRCIASESTFYRVLRQASRSRTSAANGRRTQQTPCGLCRCTEPAVSGDIIYLPTTIRGQHFYLYLFLDVFSRKIVSWQVYAEESSALASEVLRDLCAREAIQPDQAILHSGNGGPMKVRRCPLPPGIGCHALVKSPGREQ